MNGSAVLVTGAGGQLGRALATLLPGATLLAKSDLDITDPDAVAACVDRARPRVIVNAAAYTDVDGAESDPETATAVNERGAALLADAARRTGALIVYPSTNFVFSGGATAPYREDQATEPLSVYGSSKLAGERAVLGSGRALVVRTSAVFGEGRNFVATIVAAAKRSGELSVVDDQYCQPSYAPDLARCVLELVERGATGVRHVAGEPACTWAELASEALAASNIDARVHPISTDRYASGREGPVAPRPLRAILDCSTAAREGVVMKPWRQSLAEYLGSSA